MKERALQLYFLTFLFFMLTFLVAQQIMRPLDLAAMEWLQRWKHPALDYGFSFFTLIGSIEFSSFAVLVATWYLYKTSEEPTAFLYLFFFIVFSFLELILKNYIVYTPPTAEFDRNRIHWQLFFQVHAPYSFPSGHTFRSVFLLGIWYQGLCRLAEEAGSSWKIVLQKGVVFLAIFGVGYSRVYLGDHWFSDVAGGMLLAAIALVLASTPPEGEELEPA